MKIDRGVIVRQVFEGPGVDAGLLRGDVITDFDGEQIETAEQLDRLAEGIPAGITVHVRVVRSGRPQYLAVKIPGE